MSTPQTVAALITTCPGDVVIGHCPACHRPVLDSDEPVWTCPADLSDGNPHQEPADERITEELREESGVFSNCGEDYGFPCYDRMPLHGACYDSPTTTW